MQQLITFKIQGRMIYFSKFESVKVNLKDNLPVFDQLTIFFGFCTEGFIIFDHILACSQYSVNNNCNQSLLINNQDENRDFIQPFCRCTAHATPYSLFILFRVPVLSTDCAQFQNGRESGVRKRGAKVVNNTRI